MKALSFAEWSTISRPSHKRRATPYGRVIRRFCVTRLTRCLISTHTGESSVTLSRSP